jgi:hypothetical protein
MMTPLYRALCEAALSECGVLEPSVSPTGVFRDELGDLLQADDGVALILQALAFADTATGATIGREVVQTLAKRLRIDGLEARYDVECGGGHWLSDDAIEDALHRAAHAVSVQRRI